MTGNTEPCPPPGRLMGLTFGYAPPTIIEVAMRLGVFDLLDKGALGLATLVTETRSSERGLKSMLNALVGLELVSKDKNGSYAITPESSAYLVRGKPTYHGAFFMLTSRAMLKTWGSLLEVVTSGRPAATINLEEGGVEFFQQFVEDIFPIHFPAARRVAEFLEIGKMAGPVEVLDLAAGSGVWSAAMASASKDVTVTAVDWPGIIPITRKVTSHLGIGDRYRFIGGDLLDVDFGVGYRIATAGHILHSEGEERSRLLLKKTFDALIPGGVIVIAEILVDADRSGPLPALLFSVNMLVNSERGDAFSLEEISSWLLASGFCDVRTIDAPGLAPRIILATKPG